MPNFKAVLAPGWPLLSLVIFSAKKDGRKKTITERISI